MRGLGELGRGGGVSSGSFVSTGTRRSVTAEYSVCLLYGGREKKHRAEYFSMKCTIMRRT